MNEDFSSSLAVAERLAPVRRRHVRTERDEEIRELFDDCLAALKVDTGEDLRAEARGLMVVGESGAGKSRLLERLFLEHPELPGYAKTGSGCPLVTVRVKSPASLASLGSELLKAMGYPLARDKKRWEIWRLVQTQIVRQGILAIHIDEAHDILKTNAAEIEHIIDTFKTLMQDPHWPIILILSGTPELVRIANTDRQLGRRLSVYELHSIAAATHGEDIAELVADYAEKAGLRTSFVDRDALAARLIHAAANQFGATLELTFRAIRESFKEDAQALTVEHFARAYGKWTNCPSVMNPFVVDDWRTLDTKKLLQQHKPEQPEAGEDQPRKKPTPRRKTRW